MIDNKYIETTSLSAEKLELLTYLLEEEAIEFAPTQKISPRTNSDKLPLSFAQQRLWFLNQLEPDSPSYNIPVALRLMGLLNVLALQDSFNQVIKRHEVLRTTFAVVDKEPVQIIAPQQTLTIKMIDLRELLSSERETVVQQLVAEEAQQPFDLTQRPLLRSTLLHLDETEYILLFTMHHIVSDGWSMDVLVREVAALYECFTSGKPYPLPKLLIQYADYAIWQRQWLQGDVLETHLGYWKQQLGGHLPVLQLPTNRPRPNVQTYRGAKQSFKLSAELSVALENLSQQEDTTLFMTLLAAFKALLFHYTGTEDIVVGSPIANRNRAEIEKLIGCFVNILVLRTDLSGYPTFRELLGRVREVTLEAYAHQDLPFDMLVEELKPQRDLSHTPLFQVLFVFENAPRLELELSGLSVKPLKSNSGIAKFDLTLYMEETGEGFVGSIEYNTDLFEASTISQMTRHLQTLLTAIVSNPDRGLSELTPLTLAEHQQILKWNDTFVEYPKAICIHQEMSVAAKTPVEELLAEIWIKILGVEKVGIHDNFFELGGHSLLATRVIALVREVFQVELPLRHLFESPTIAELAKRLETKIRTGKGLEALPIEPIIRRENLPLSFAQERLWVFDQLDPGSSTYNVPTAVRLTGSLNIAALEQSLTAVVTRHEVLRTIFPTVDGQPMQVISPATTFTLPVIDLRETKLSPLEQEAEAQRIALEEAERPFNLAQGPLLRVMLLQLDEAEYVLLLTMHHIISDLWSMGILIRELAALYEAFCSGKSHTLPELPIQYADYAVWQRQWMQGDVLQTQVAYWKQQLEGAPTELALPTDYPRSQQSTSTGTKQNLLLPKDLSEELMTLNRREGVTLYMSLLTAFNTLLYYYTQQEDILVGSPIANRNRCEVEGLIGFFINTLVLRTDLSGNPSFRELLHRLRERTLGAYAHQDLPFEKLVGELHLGRDLNYNPLFQVWFTLQNISTPDLETLTLSLPGLTLSSFEIGKKTVPFDLALLLSEKPEGISGCFEYKTDLFEARTILRMAEHFEMLLKCVVSQPDIRLKQLVEKLNESSQKQQLVKEQEYKNTLREKLMQIKQKSYRESKTL